MTKREEMMFRTIKWLYYRLLDYMSGSGSTVEEDHAMAQIKRFITLLEEL